MAFSPALHLHHPPRLHHLLLSSNHVSTSSSCAQYPWLSAWSRPRHGLRPPAPARDLRPEPSPTSDSDDEDAVGTSRHSGRSTMSLILRRLKRAGYSPEAQIASSTVSQHPRRGSVEDVFRGDDGVLPNARGGFDDDAESSLVDARFPWERPMPAPKAAARAARSPAWMAELTLPEPELRRLRHAAMRIKSKTQVGGAGVTQEIVAKFKEKWRTDEVVRVKVNGTPALNMRLFHEIVEEPAMAKARARARPSPAPPLEPASRRPPRDQIRAPPPVPGLPDLSSDLKSLDEQLDRHLARAWTMEKPQHPKRGGADDQGRRREDWEADPARLVVRGVIARGTFGTVHRGVYDGLDVAVKLLDWGEDGHRSEQEITAIRAAFSQEVSVWHKLDHPNVTKVT